MLTSFCTMLVKVLPGGTLRFVERYGPQHAASIAFFAILALVPGVLMLASALARLVMEVPVAGAQSPLEQTLDSLALALPAFKGRVRELVTELAETHTSLNLVSGISLLFAAGGAFSAMERGVNVMLETEKKRHFLGIRFLLAGFILVVTLALFVWRVVSAFVPRLLAELGVDLPVWLLTNPATEVLIQLGVTAVGFFVLIRMLATEKLSRASRWGGAISFALLFHASRIGLDVFLSSTPLQEIYGTLMAFVGLILWLYLVSFLMLLNCAWIHAFESHLTGKPYPGK